MKSYEQIAESVRRKAQARIEEKKRRRKIALRSSLATAFCAAALVGFITVSGDVFRGAPDRRSRDYRQDTVSMVTTAAEHIPDETEPSDLTTQDAAVQTTAVTDIAVTTAQIKKTLPARHTEAVQSGEHTTPEGQTSPGSSHERQTTAAGTTAASGKKTTSANTAAVRTSAIEKKTTAVRTTAVKTTAGGKKTTATRTTAVRTTAARTTAVRTTAVRTTTAVVRTTVQRTTIAPIRTTTAVQDAIAWHTTATTATQPRPMGEMPTENPTAAYTTTINDDFREDDINDTRNNYSFVYDGNTYNVVLMTVSSERVGGIVYGDEYVTLEGVDPDTGELMQSVPSINIGTAGDYSGDFCRVCKVYLFGGYKDFPAYNLSYAPDTLKEFLDGIGFEKNWSVNGIYGNKVKAAVLALDSSDAPGEGFGSAIMSSRISVPGFRNCYLRITDKGYFVFDLGNIERGYYVGVENAVRTANLIYTP